MKKIYISFYLIFMIYHEDMYCIYNLILIDLIIIILIFNI